MPKCSKYKFFPYLNRFYPNNYPNCLKRYYEKLIGSPLYRLFMPSFFYTSSPKYYMPYPNYQKPKSLLKREKN